MSSSFSPLSLTSTLTYDHDHDHFWPFQPEFIPQKALVKLRSQLGVLTTYDKSLPLLLRLPVDIHLRIWEYLHPVERACFSLASRHLIYLLNRHSPRIALSAGSPLSHNPLSKELGCRHCVPALYSPAHCELHFHLRSLFPRHLTYCYNCEIFTSHEKKGYSDSGEYCGICTAKYSRMFERGRRRIGNLDDDFGMVEAGAKIWRGGRWYNKFLEPHPAPN